MVRLVHAEKYDAFDAISAIALEHGGGFHERIIDAWDRANRSGFLRQGVASRIAMEDQLQIERELFDTDFDHGVLLAPCASLPLKGIRDSLELAVRHTYQVAHNFLCRGGFDPGVVLAVHAVEQLERLGYETGLVLRAIAVEDVWDLLDTGDIGADDAWRSALHDNSRMAAERLQNAKSERFVAAMSELQMEDETMGADGNKKPSLAWIGVLSNSGKVDPAQVIKSKWMRDATHREDFAKIERDIGTMDLDEDDTEQEQEDTDEDTSHQWLWTQEEVVVTDEEVREFEQMLKD